MELLLMDGNSETCRVLYQNKVGKQCILLAFIMRIYHDALSSECQNISQHSKYTGCPRRNGQNFGRVFLMLKYTEITQNTYIQS